MSGQENSGELSVISDQKIKSYKELLIWQKGIALLNILLIFLECKPSGLPK